MRRPSAEQQLEGFIAKHAPAIANQTRTALKKLRARLPGAVAMVYDNYNALVVGFVRSERPADALLSVVVYPRYVSLAFLRGADLPDPDRLLRGSGKRVRGMVLDTPAALDLPAVQELIGHAIRGQEEMFEHGPGRLVIRSVSKNQRPRRPPFARVPEKA